MVIRLAASPCFCGLTDGDFIDKDFVSQANIPTVLLEEPREVSAINGNLLVRVIHMTSPLSQMLSGNHQETLRLFMISSPQSPVVLGLPWLKRHNPNIDWTTASIYAWSDSCHRRSRSFHHPAWWGPSYGGSNRRCRRLSVTRRDARQVNCLFCQVSGLKSPANPRCPWSHITVDFITCLPPFEGNTTILTIPKRFSKAAHFMPLTALPTALETANLLVTHMFCLHGILSQTGVPSTSQV